MFSFDDFAAWFILGKNMGYLIGDCLFLFNKSNSYIIIPRSLIVLVNPTFFMFQSTTSASINETNDHYLCIRIKIDRPKKLLSRRFLNYMIIQSIKTEKKSDLIGVSDEARSQVISNLMMNNRLKYMHG